MKKLIILLMLLLTISFNLHAQLYDPCADLRTALLDVNKMLADGDYKRALEVLERFKNKPEMQKCEDFKSVNYQISEIKKKLESGNGSSTTPSSPPSGSFLSCPDNNHPHMIDLGLPSGTKWACCNVGANKPEDYGDYYAWGETQTKSNYNDDTYLYYKNGSYQNIGSDIAGTQYDVAHVKWGGSWVMPSRKQQDELRENCTYEWTTVKGVKGGKFTSKKNGASIFLPAAGRRWDDSLSSAGSRGDYWSSTQDPSNSVYAYYLYFNSGYAGWGSYSRYYGRSVRPVSR